MVNTISTRILFPSMVILLMLSCNKEEYTLIAGKITDPAGMEYSWKRMKDRKIWLTQNLSYDIPGYDSWVYNDDPVNGNLYGRLYDWEAANAACAALGDGWRLPNDDEWKNLAVIYGGYLSVVVEDVTVGNPKQAYRALLLGGASGFEAPLGGIREILGEFKGLDYVVTYWSSSGNGRGANWCYQLNGYFEELIRNQVSVQYGFSCRCIKD